MHGKSRDDTVSRAAESGRSAGGWCIARRILPGFRMALSVSVNNVVVLHAADGRKKDEYNPIGPMDAVWGELNKIRGGSSLLEILTYSGKIPKLAPASYRAVGYHRGRGTSTRSDNLCTLGPSASGCQSVKAIVRQGRLLFAGALGREPNGPLL